MYLSLGNVFRNPQVGLLFADFASPKRLRVNGDASIDEADPLLATFTDRSSWCVCAPRTCCRTVPATCTGWSS
jgi:hypothetical protein